MSQEAESKLKLTRHFKERVRDVRKIWTEIVPSLKEDLNDLEFILHSLKKKDIKYKPKNKNVPSDRIINDEDDSGTDSSSKSTKNKKRGRPPKASTLVQDRLRSGSSESVSLDDSVSSTTSNRSRRAAAQAADQKLAQVQSFIKATKLRRPTDFDEKQLKRSNIVSSPPAKCRKTHQSSASSIPEDIINVEVEDDDVFEKETIVNKTRTNRAKSKSLEEPQLVSHVCTVDVTRINTPEIKLRMNRAKSRSSERPLKRKSEDLFNDSDPLSVMANKKSGKQNVLEKIEQEMNLVNLTVDLNTTYHTKNKEGRGKKLKSKKDADSGISSNGGEVNEVVKENLPPQAHSSPIPRESPPLDEFRGFSHIPKEAGVTEKQTLLKGNTFIKVDDQKFTESVKCVETEQGVIRKTVGRNKQEERDEIEVSCVKSRTKVLRTTRKLENHENKNEQENEENDIDIDDDPSAVRTRTRVIKKAIQASDKRNDSEVHVNGLVEDKSPETNVRSRTKTIRKKTSPSDSAGEESSLRSRTKTIKKGVQSNDVIEDLNSKYLASEFKEPHVLNNKQNKINMSELPKSPGVSRGEVVKKRVEDFEKLKNEMQVEEEAVGRCTRNTAKNKTQASASEPLTSKRNRNIPNSKLLSASKVLSVETGKSTPLGTSNKMTPKFGSNPRIAAVNKVPSSTETTTAVVQKQASEEAERKKREEERKRRKAKEEEAKIKKEIALKATAETRRRKREEQFSKVTAKKEAAEREKALAAAKAEKEKEEKMRLIAAEKEKVVKEEQLKKKLQSQQKAQEHEERRKQEEAARLAKLKEQEEEQKRVMAMKEREQEIQKLQKATDLKLADAEKTKNHDSKLAKLAAFNNAKLKMQQGNTPVTKANGGPAAGTSYELTPGRDERPLLKPKTENNYGIDDANSSDSSEDESRPKKQIPEWAQSKNRDVMLKVHNSIPQEMWTLFMQADRRPDINKLFAGNIIRKRVRTSSAVWNTPPL